QPRAVARLTVENRHRWFRCLGPERIATRSSSRRRWTASWDFFRPRSRSSERGNECPPGINHAPRREKSRYPLGGRLQRKYHLLERSLAWLSCFTSFSFDLDALPGRFSLILALSRPWNFWANAMSP